jgi:hypothetical protein
VIRRLPQFAFGLLALATIGAFFLVQAVKTAAPFLWVTPNPIPASFNPIRGRLCTTSKGTVLNYRQTSVTFSVSRADTVGVYIVSADNPGGSTIATVSAGTPMAASPNATVDARTFSWNGRMADGQFASHGTYYFRIVLEKEGRSIDLSTRPVQVLTRPPHPRILAVGPLTATATGTRTGTTTTDTGKPAAGKSTNSTGTTTTGSGSSRSALRSAGPAVLSPPRGGVRIDFKAGNYKDASIDIYRTDVAGGPELVSSLPIADPKRGWIVWHGKIDGEPAPAGTYLIGISVEDQACNGGRWPSAVPRASGVTPHAGVTISYLSVTPPLVPTASGARASVAVDSAGAAFSWRLRRAGTSRTVARGSGPAGSSTLRVRMPRRRAGLYTLTVNAGAQSAAVPLVASQAGAAAAHARVLVVLPMLTWMGDTPVDDSGDGLPDTLRAGNDVSLARPLVDGPPAGFGADAGLLSYLSAHDLGFQLTTDVALAEGVGPSLADRGGVVFPEGENFLPAELEPTLRGFVRGGGRALVLGTRALSAVSHISGFPATPRAGAPVTITADPFGARRGQLTPTGGELISSVRDDALSLFHDAGEYGGFSRYQPISPPSGTPAADVSAIGIGSATPAIVGFHDGSGTVVEVGLSGFAASLAHNPDASSLLSNVWSLLSQ